MWVEVVESRLLFVFGFWVVFWVVWKGHFSSYMIYEEKKI
jgi:hypothetical protein